MYQSHKARELPEENGMCTAGEILCIISMDTLVKFLTLP